MDNILELDPLQEAKNTLEKVEFMAKALAYGALEGIWSLTFISFMATRNDDYTRYEEWSLQNSTTQQNVQFGTYLNKWGDQKPLVAFLVSFGYLEIIGYTPTPKQQNPIYQLTEKAFNLLKEPSRERKIFISYRRDSSSAFGLLVVARLQAVGIQNPFIDMNIDPGDAWHALLERRVKECDVFISLISPRTLESPYVLQEILWALQTPNIDVIPVWHEGFANSADYPTSIATLANYNAIRVKEESAEEYNNAIVRLLNHLGYAP